jgi:hypothetical protein
MKKLTLLNLSIALFLNQFVFCQINFTIKVIEEAKQIDGGTFGKPNFNHHLRGDAENILFSNCLKKMNIDTSACDVTTEYDDFRKIYSGDHYPSFSRLYIRTKLKDGKYVPWCDEFHIQQKTPNTRQKPLIYIEYFFDNEENKLNFILYCQK